MERKNRASEAMELHKKGHSTKEIAEIMEVSVKNVENLLHRARNPRIHEIQGHYKKIITALDEDISIRGKYMAVTMKNVLSNITLMQGSLYQDASQKTYNLVEFLYHNIWLARISITSGELCMIDSDGFQHKLTDICDYHSYTKWVHGSEADEVYFPWPELTLESKAKTKGWWWLRPLKDGILPYRFILRFDIFKPGDTSGWVKDNETIEFEFPDISLVATFASRSVERFKRGEIGQSLNNVRDPRKKQQPDLELNEEQQPDFELDEEQQPEIPQKIMQIIREKAEAEWPDDFEMQKHVIDNQVNAYLEINED